MRKKLPSPPIVDLHGTVKIIVDTVSPPVWLTLESGIVATEKNAKQVLRDHGYKCGWLFDSLGHKTFIQV